MLLLRKNTPRWLIFLTDIFISLFSTFVAYLLRFNFEIPKIEWDSFSIVFPFVLLVRGITFYIARTNAGIIRYTSTKDTERIFIAVSIGSLIFSLANLLSFKFYDEKFIIPFSVIIIDFMATMFIMVAYRIFIKIAYFEIKNPSRQKNSVIIYGAGEAGIISKRTLDKDAGSKFKVVAFIDDNPSKAKRKLEGIPIHHASMLEELIESGDIHHVIVSIQNIHHNKLNVITELCLKYNTKVLNVPPVSKWINGELSFKQIKKVKIEDLLGRDLIKLDELEIRKQISNKTVLVTGAAGSIGSELARQITKYSPKKLVLLDQAESPLYELEVELNEKRINKNCEVVIGDIRNASRLERIFETFRPNIVYHAAAYKHVPLMENNPCEATQTNIIGTKYLAEMAIKYNVKRFVMISTDKAVNPTNVMGASKRIAEIFIQGLNQNEKTEFITTRFGNVLGSNGSVIPLFKRQIEQGGPITVTHPEITRYFMTIPEACQLVLEASAIGKGGEIYIFDMGDSVKIVDLAKKMVKLSGLELGKDIQIVYSGMRPGEKLYEELLNDKESTLETHHPQIMRANTIAHDFNSVCTQIQALVNEFDQQNNIGIVKIMKEMVPEYKSRNSIFEELDA
jgi:FlaA1/EpsC-like NDP-sugar epimerase